MRRAHVLKQNHHTRLPLRMIWVDTEAINEEGKPEAGRQTLNFGVAIYESYKNSDATEPQESKTFRFTSAADFWEWATGFVVGGRAVWIMAHNWNYDAGILNTGPELRSRGWDLAKYINGKPPLIVRWRKGGASLIMVDTLNYFTTSVESLGNAVNLPKLDMPKDMDSEAWNLYAWRDVEIIKKAFLKFREFVRENDLGVMQPTLASQALTSYRHRFMHTPILIHDNEKALDLEREAYHGGRTESFWRGPTREHLYKMDINSMYPAIMRETPLGHWLEGYYPTYKESCWNEALQHSLVARVVVETTEPCYGVVKGSKLIFPVGRFPTVLTTPEIHYAIEHGHIKEIGEFAYYRQSVLFSDYVDYFYQQRSNYKAESNDSFQYLCKILLNSLYGKFGQSGRKWVETQQYEWDADTAGVLRVGDTDIKLRNRLGKTQVLEKEGESENSAPMIAAEITAHARMQLWKLIRQAGETHVYYVDTDSLIVDQQGYDNLSDHIDPSRLGALKLEGESDYSEFWAPKHYVFGAEWKIKGVRKSAAQNIATRGWEQEQFRSWDYHLSQGDDGFIDVKPITKFTSGENTKRVVLGDYGWTRAIKL